MGLEGFDEVREDEIVLSFEDAIKEALKQEKRYLKPEDVENGTTVVKILNVGKAYKRDFGAGERIRIDLEVKALNGAEKGKTFVFSIGTKNIKELLRTFGRNKEDWVNKKIMLKVEDTGRFRYVLITGEYKPLEVEE